MANIANLITKLSGIIASLDDIRDAISQGGGGSSTASGVTVTPVAPLTGTNLQATTNETAALLQDHADEISTLNSSMVHKEVITGTTTSGGSINLRHPGTLVGACVTSPDNLLAFIRGDGYAAIKDANLNVVASTSVEIACYYIEP